MLEYSVLQIILHDIFLKHENCIFDAPTCAKTTWQRIIHIQKND